MARALSDRVMGPPGKVKMSQDLDEALKWWAGHIDTRTWPHLPTLADAYLRPITLRTPRVSPLLVWPPQERIEVGEEITYDYKFELETDDSKRIPCSCGTAKCNGFLN